MLARKLTRLPSMGHAEIAYRIHDWAAVQKERRLSRRPEGAAGAAPALPTGPDGTFVGFLRAQGMGAFYRSAAPGARRPLAALFARRFPAWLAAAWDEAERLCAHRIELLGHGEIDLGIVIEWHRDPVTRKTWERRFWADYDLTRECDAGDPKRVLELNRHQHLPRLAKAHWLFGEERYAEEVLDQMESWIVQNPAGHGIHWHSSHDIALRALSWTWALALVAHSRALHEDRARRIGDALFAQLDHVFRHPSLYSSPNTHLLGEATALYVAGLLFGAGAPARTWLAKGAEILESQATRQIGADGVHVELSTWYHCHALDGYLQALALARRNGAPVAPRVAARVEAMLDFLLEVARPDGSIPLLSDDDGGRTLALASTHYQDVSDLLCAGAILFGRPDLKWASRGMRESALWLAGPNGASRYDALESRRPSSLRASFLDAGYFVQRTGWDDDASHLVFDCGGAGILGGGHAHADALSFTLFSHGRDLVVDPGTFVYNGLSTWRDAFRGGGAHNTAIVDGLDAWIPDGTFRWRRVPGARLLSEASGDGIDYVAGEVAAGRAGVIHRRRLLLARPGTWFLVDDFRGGIGEHDYEVAFHLAPGASVRRIASFDDRGGGLEITVEQAGIALHVLGSAPTELRIVRAGVHPVGWVSSRYGEMRPAPVLVARFRAAGEAALLTVMAPFRAGCERPIHVRQLAIGTHPAARPALALAVRGATGVEDVVATAPGAALMQLEDQPRVRAQAIWQRIERGRPARVLRVDGEAVAIEDGRAASAIQEQERPACAR